MIIFFFSILTRPFDQFYKYSISWRQVGIDDDLNDNADDDVDVDNFISFISSLKQTKSLIIYKP